MEQHEQVAGGKLKLEWREALGLLLPYLREKLWDQVKSIWFVIAYLVVFQIFVLDIPIVYAASIALGIGMVALGLTFFMEGLRLGLMPLGEIIGALLPRNVPLLLILGFAFFLGLGAAFAEPGIAILRAAGSTVTPGDAPLLHYILNQQPGQLVFAIAAGVGLGTLLGVLRFFQGWSLKTLLYPIIGLLLVLTAWAGSDPLLAPILGLAWDAGVVTTGPVTVPLVLALGIGICRIVGGEDSGSAGFGIVTLSALMPVILVLLLAKAHLYTGSLPPPPPAAVQNGPTALAADITEPDAPASPAPDGGISEEEYLAYLHTGSLPDDTRIRHIGGEITWESGRIIQRNAAIVFERDSYTGVTAPDVPAWNPESPLLTVSSTLMAATQAVLPLCAFLLITLRLILRERPRHLDELLLGIGFAYIGMFLFNFGLETGLTPLGIQLGSNIPASFTNIQPWGLDTHVGPLLGDGFSGIFLVVAFGFFLGYGATLAEPALNALGSTVQKTTAGAFRKNLLMQSVALGMALGISLGVIKVIYNIPLPWLIIPPYLLLLVLTYFSTEEFVNFAWDSAGVTTGPITVPLILAMGLGIGANIPGVSNGFGVLALAAIGPVITVLAVGLIVRHQGKVKHA